MIPQHSYRFFCITPAGGGCLISPPQFVYNNLNIPYHHCNLTFNTFACTIKQALMSNGEINIFSEEQLLNRLSNHDREAFTIIYNTYAKKLFRYAFKVIKSSEIAEDTVHDIFVKLWNNAADLKIETSLQAYLYKSTYFHLLNLLKKGTVQQKFVKEVTHTTDQSSQCTEENVFYKETLKQVQYAVNSLPPQRKLIFEMGRNQGMSHRQIAQQLQIADSTVNNQIVKALKTIKNHLLAGGSISMLALLLSLIKK